VETNQSKKYSVNADLVIVKRTLFGSRRYGVNYTQRFRFSDKFSIRHDLFTEPQQDNVGFTDIVGSDIIFGRRDRNTIENIFNFKYNFNSRMGLNTRIRHYWSKVEYREFFTLQADGGLEQNPAYSKNRNINDNYFNIDMVYTWQFGPGSFLNIVWKNAVYTSYDQVERNYLKNFSNTIESDQNNNLSLKVIYFLDYLDFKKWKKGKK
jgi:hypothetical protein